MQTMRMHGIITKDEMSLFLSNKTFPILSSARPRTNVILARKCDNHRENVAVAKPSYHMLGILPPSTEIGELTFEV